MPFDATAEANYLSQVRTELAYEWYEDQVSTYLASNDPGKTLADVPYTGPIQQQVVHRAADFAVAVLRCVLSPAADNPQHPVPSQYEYAVQISLALPQTGAIVSGRLQRTENTTTLPPLPSVRVGAVNTPLVVHESGGPSRRS